MNFRSIFAVSSLTLALSTLPAHAWLPQGHSILARAAVQSLPTDVPDWFRNGADQIAHDAQDPDVQKSRDLPMMTEAEAPQHFIDTELLQGRPFPATRKEFYALCAELKLDPGNVGELPYSLTEWTQRLTQTFAEARKFPNNRFIQTKALVYAGILAHYAGDATMPLHVTNDYDGHANQDGSSPKTGIHLKVDSLVEKVAPTLTELTQNQKIEAMPDVWAGVLAEIETSRTHITETYNLETQLPPTPSTKDQWTPSPQVRTFTLERGREGTRFIAQLLLTAWEDSAKIKLPTWLERE